MLSQNLLNWKQAQLKVNHRLKKISKGEKGRRKKKKTESKKKKKTQKPKDVGSTKFGFQRIPERKCRKT